MNTINAPYFLLVDDDEEDLTVLATSLQKQGIKTKSFANADKAILFLEHITEKDELPTMIVSDYHMPGMNGRQILSIIKSNKRIEKIPVVVYSSTMPPTLKKDLLSLGALDCFIKPGSLTALSFQVKLLKELAFPTIKETNYILQPEFSLS